MKEKLPLPSLYDDMKRRGITFNDHKKKEVLEILETKNYYYKLAAFRKNFEKIDGRYVNLDFSYLVDLAIIDMHIRNYLLEVSLSVEHFIKTEISRLLNANQKEDGYSIVQEFKEKKTYSYNKTMRYFEKTRYQKDMYIKRKEEMSIWAFMEHTDYSSLLDLVDVYYLKNKSKTLKKASQLGGSTRNIRNACAHNSVFLIEWFNEMAILENNPAGIKSLADEIGIEKEKYQYAKVNDLIALFSLLKSYCSKEVKKHYYQSGKELIERCLRKEESYINAPRLEEKFIILIQLVDFLEE